MSSEALEFWSNKLKNLTSSVLPFDFVVPAEGKVVEASYRFSFTPEFENNLSTIAAAVSQSLDKPVSSFNTALAIYTLLVFRLTGDEDIVLGTSTADSKAYVFRSFITGKTSFTDIVS